MINHGNNLISMFLHLNDIFIAQDQIVKKGEIIGTIGSTGLSTGPHLHWSVLLNNAYINPLALVNN
jgi:murein DD-endopeptidase MepM/ murein hydrolase activator NlpD